MANDGAFLDEAGGSVLLTDAVHHVIWKVKDGMKSVFAGLEIPLGYDGTDRPLGAYLDGATDKSFFDKPVGIAAMRQVMCMLPIQAIMPSVKSVRRGK